MTGEPDRSAPDLPRAVRVHAAGPPETFTLDPFDPGEPGPGDVLIDVRAAGVSFADVLLATGGHQFKPDYPFIPGSELAGRIVAMGEGVAPSRLGERIAAVHLSGAYAERLIVPARAAFRLPDDLGFAQAASFQISYGTAYHALVQRAGIRPGETVLVLGAGGSVGYAAVQVAKALGARVIGSASSGAKAEFAIRGGADAMIDSHSPAWRAEVMAATSGRAVDIVFDPVGSEATERAFRTLGWKGRHLIVGFAAGAIPALPANLPLLKGAALVGVEVRKLIEREPDVWASNMRALLELAEGRAIDPVVGRSFPLEDFSAAMRLAKSGQAIGRCVIEMRDRPQSAPLFTWQHSRHRSGSYGP